MQDAETVLGILRERGRKGLPCEELYRQLFNPQLYLLAYGRIYANHGAMAAGLIAWLRTARDPLTACICILFAAKLGWEHVHGALPFTSATLSVPVVHQAHTYGAIGGSLVALMLTRRRRTVAASL